MDYWRASRLFTAVVVEDHLYYCDLCGCVVMGGFYTDHIARLHPELEEEDEH